MCSFDKINLSKNIERDTNSEMLTIINGADWSCKKKRFRKRIRIGSPHLYMKKRVSVANGLVDIRPLEQFCVMVANFSASDVTLAKHEVVALALQAPAKVFTVNVDPRQLPDQKPDRAGRSTGSSWGQRHCPGLRPEFPSRRQCESA